MKIHIRSYPSSQKREALRKILIGSYPNSQKREALRKIHKGSYRTVKSAKCSGQTILNYFILCFIIFINELFFRLNEKIKKNSEKHYSELENIRNERFKLESECEEKENEIKKLKREINELNKVSERKLSFEAKEEEYKLVQYEYEENIVEVRMK